ncbi:MAG TPA: sulfurtransferase TusA family protein [Candidatus Limnocylindrales bacterium]
MTTALTDSEIAAAVAKVVDARGSACPGPLLEAKKGIGSVSIGSVLEIWSSDPVTKSDIGAWSGKVGHEFLAFMKLAHVIYRPVALFFYALKPGTNAG